MLLLVLGNNPGGEGASILGGAKRSLKRMTTDDFSPRPDTACLHEIRGVKNSVGSQNFMVTLPETNIAPTNGWLEYYFPIGEAYFQGLR